MSEGFLPYPGPLRYGSTTTATAGARGIGGIIRRLHAAQGSGGYLTLGLGGRRRLADPGGDKTGSGELVAGSATMSGSGSREIIDLGTYDELVCGEATMSGSGTVSATGINTGVLIAGEATMSGTGTVIHEWSPQQPGSGNWTKQGPASGGWTKQ